jgi:hypothetical protein
MTRVLMGTAVGVGSRVGVAVGPMSGMPPPEQPARKKAPVSKVASALLSDFLTRNKRIDQFSYKSQ